MANNNMGMVLQALLNAGLSSNQARILGAEIGRENSFQDKYLWGYHSDDKNKAINIGIISWQGNRGRGVENALKQAGLIKNGVIVKGQASLDVMAKYLVNEIRTNPTYAQTRKQFLDNPNVDYNTATAVLGRNFIRWRYDDPKYKKGHRNRDHFYAQLGGVVPSGNQGTSQEQPAINTANTQQEALPQVATATPQVDTSNPFAIAQAKTPSVESILGKNVQADGTGNTVLTSGAGLAQASNPFEQKMFTDIFNSGVDSSREKSLVAASQAVSSAYQQLQGGNLMQEDNPMRHYVATIFDNV